MKILIWYLGKVKANDTFGPRNATKPKFLLNIDFAKINTRRLIQNFNIHCYVPVKFKSQIPMYMQTSNI